MVGRHRMVPGGSRYAIRPRASCRISSAQPCSASPIVEPATRPRATLNAMRGLSRSSHGRNVRHASTGCRVRCARDQTERPCGAITSSRTLPISAASRSHHRPQRDGHVRIGESERIDGDDEPGRQRSRGSARPAARWRHARRSRRRGRTSRWCPNSAPAAACRRGRGARASAECRRGRRSSRARAPTAGVGAKCGVAQTGRHRRGGAGRRAARHTIRRAGVERRAVECVLTQDTQGDLVGDGLADQRRAGVEQRLHRPGVPGRHRMVRAQSWLPPPVGWPATSNRSFAAKVRPRNGPCARAVDGDARAGDEGVDRVGHHSLGAAGGRAPP